MVLRKTLLSCAALTLLTGMAVSTAHAQVQLSFTGGVFNFDSTSGFSSAAGTTTAFDFFSSGGTTVDFNGQMVKATITLSGTVSGPATEVTVGGSSTIVEQLSGITETITGTSSSQYFKNKVLISTSGVSGQLAGAAGGNNVTFTLGGSGIFSSSVFSLAGAQNQTMQATTNNALSLTASSTTTSGPVTISTGTLGGFQAVAHSNVFNSAAGSPVPEASTLMGLGSLVLGGGFLSLRRRKA